MAVYHDPETCELEPCPLCSAYEKGYSRGKGAAYAEIRARLNYTTHTTDCGCEPCLIIRSAGARRPLRVRVASSEVLPDPASAPPQYEPVEKRCKDCSQQFITPPSNPRTEQCGLHRAFSRPRPARRFGDPI